jgi:hypothetical protein
MGARRLATLAIAALIVAGCGEEDFENRPRPPVPMELTGVIQDDKVTISPAKNIGAGPFVITISNQTDAAKVVTLEGGSITEKTDNIPPLETATIQRTLDPGSYEVRAGSERAVRKEIAPAVLDIGEERENSNSDLLLP